MQAEPIAPTVDMISWEEAVTLGSHAWESSEQSKWDLGDIGAIVAHKWQGDSIKKFADSIGMHDNPRRLYEYVSVAQFWQKDARAHFRDCTWSAFRECSRHGLTIDRASTIMYLHGKQPVAAIRAIIIGRAAPPKPVTATFDVDSDFVIQPVAELRRYQDILAKYPDATTHIVVTWTPGAANIGRKETP